jgi:hypothetical protein
MNSGKYMSLNWQKRSFQIRIIEAKISRLIWKKTYGKKIMFIKMENHGKFESYLVASYDIDLESAITGT